MEKDVNDNFKMSWPRKNPLIVESNIFKSMTDFELSPKEMEKAHLELGETDEVREECLQKLKRMLLNDRNVKYRTDDQYLLRYLRFRKFDCERAYNSLKKLYYYRKNCTDIFNIPTNLKSLLNINMATALPYTDENGRIIFYTNVGKWNPEDVPVKDAMGFTTCIADIFTMNPRCQVNGVIFIWDVKDLKISHFSHLFTTIPTISSIILNCYPWRVKYVFVLNAGRLTQLLYNVVRPLLTKKIKERVFLLSDFYMLHECINPELLPKIYGGKLEEEEYTISEFILENAQYLEYERSFF